MIAWLQELRLLAEAEFHARRILATLATVGLDGTPRARTVIVRGIDEDGTLLITANAESEKVAQLTKNPAVELLFWFAHERQQYRLRGRMEVLREGDPVGFVWQDLTDAARALFFGPPPGVPRTPEQVFPESVSRDTPPPASFVVLRLTPDDVETLDLNEHPHCRRCWRRRDGTEEWSMDEITP